MTFPVKHDTSNFLVELIERVLKPLFKLFGHKEGLMSPLFQTLGNEIVGEALKSLILFFHLIVLSVECHTQLDVLDIFGVKNVAADVQLLDAEVSLQGRAHRMSTSFIDLTVVDLKLSDRHVALQEVGYSLCTVILDIAVSEFQHFQ